MLNFKVTLYSQDLKIALVLWMRKCVFFSCVNKISSDIYWFILIQSQMIANFIYFSNSSSIQDCAHPDIIYCLVYTYILHIFILLNLYVYIGLNLYPVKIREKRSVLSNIFFFFAENLCFRIKMTRHKIGYEIPSYTLVSYLPFPQKD